MLLLEKAWAKIYGSYENIEAGFTREAMFALTGAPTKYFAIDKETNENDEELWQTVNIKKLNIFFLVS